jgi:hypothetical protein
VTAAVVPERRLAAARWIGAGVCAIALGIASFFGGQAYNEWQARRALAVTAAPGIEAAAAPKATVRTPSEPRADAERKRIVDRDRDAIRDEQPGNDWNKWQADTATYRAMLKRRLDLLRDISKTKSQQLEEDAYEPLEGDARFPLFEIRAKTLLRYLVEPDLLTDFRQTRPAIAVHRWLRQQGIDLIFVSVPKMTEVYIEHFLQDAPRDGVIAPHVRRTLLELLEADVETVDGFRLFRPLRNTDLLYNTCDPHWSPRGMRVMARELADRIDRYDFGTKARYSPPLFRPVLIPYVLDEQPGGIRSRHGWANLSEEQQQKAEAHQLLQATALQTVDGRPLKEDKAAPVMLIGHSFARYFREELERSLNQQVRYHISDNSTTEAFTDFVRDPALLHGVRVLVWITTPQHMTTFKPLPGPVMEVLK